MITRFHVSLIIYVVNIVSFERENNEKPLGKNFRYSNAATYSLSFWSYLIVFGRLQHVRRLGYVSLLKICLNVEARKKMKSSDL